MSPAASVNPNTYSTASVALFITSRTCDSSASISMIVTSGNSLTSSTSAGRWSGPRCTLVISVPVTSSSTPGENTTKKLGRNESHCTSRRLVTRALTASPATSYSSSSPSFRPSSSAYSRSTETSARPFRCASHQRPAISRLSSRSCSAQVRLASRSTNPRARSDWKSMSSTAISLIRTRRARIIGTSSVAGRPRCEKKRLTACPSSGRMLIMK